MFKIKDNIQIVQSRNLSKIAVMNTNTNWQE